MSPSRCASWVKLVRIAIGIVVCIGILSCSSHEPDSALAALRSEEVIEALKLEPAENRDGSVLSQQESIVLDIDEFVSDFVTAQGAAPMWLAIDGLSADSDMSQSQDNPDAEYDWLYTYVSSEHDGEDNLFIWSLYWFLAMPPVAVQQEILEKEIGNRDSSEWDVAGFRSRYSGYLEQLARAWLDVNADSKPDWLRID